MIDQLSVAYEFVKTGRLDGGECPECGHQTLVVTYDDGVWCDRDACTLDAELPEAPKWL